MSKLISRPALRTIEQICPGRVLLDVPLARISRWRIGGPADLIVQPETVQEIQLLRGWLHNEGIPSVVIGETSNLLFSDDGLRTPCIQLTDRFGSISVNETEVTADAGVWVPRLARRIMHGGLTGAEHICGIPGTLGGLICMNGGSQRKSIGNSVVAVTSVSLDGTSRRHDRADCGFRYRTSMFQDSDEVIVSVQLRFAKALDRKSPRTEMLKILAARRQKFPQKFPNCGSVFISDPALYNDHGAPGALLERLGFKGTTIGGAQISTRHANFINNLGDATALDVLQLIGMICERVKNETGHQLRAEARFVDPIGRVTPLHMAALHCPHTSD